MYRPAYGPAMLAHRIRGVYAMPITVAGLYIGALDVFAADPATLTVEQIIGVAEAAELAYFGAKVLHPSTIFPAVARNIPVRILNSHRPAGTGTLITADPPPGDRPFAALACKRGITILDITSTRMLMTHGFLRRLFEVFERHTTPVDVVTTSEVSVSVTIDDSRRLPAIVTDLSEFAEVSSEANLALICAVGDGLATDRAFASRLLNAVDGVPLRMVSQAASRRNVTIVIAAADLPAALNRLHDRFFGELDERVGSGEAYVGPTFSSARGSAS
jgi:aspartate kinase